MAGNVNLIIKQKYTRLVLLLSIFNMSLSLFYAQNTHALFYEEHAEGWHWYKNNIEEKKIKIK